MDPETLNGSCSLEPTEPNYYHGSTSPSAGESFSSCHSHSPDRLKALNVIQFNLNKDIQILDTAETLSLEDLPDANARRIGNFEKRYLDIGNWPEMTAEQEKSLRIKYSALKTKYVESETEKIRLEKLLRSTEVNKCENCDLLNTKLKDTKEALGQAVELSKVLLQEVRKVGNL